MREVVRGPDFGAVTEAVKKTTPVVMTEPTLKQVRRTGFEYGIPLSAITTSQQIAGTSERQQILNQLHQLYMTCDWVSSCVDVIARTVTAGGLQVSLTTEEQEGDRPEDPPEVQRLKRLMRFVNPREDMVQLLRSVVTDLQLFGDAYLEIVSLLGEPIALYTLDSTTMTVISDQHGEVTGYNQSVDGIRSADFDPDQVIHFSLDAPRGGLYGVGPAQKILFPATTWLFAMATLKECFRRGDPPRLHVDLGHFQDNDVQRWREQYTVNNLGPKAVGAPVITTGGGGVQVLDPHKVGDYLEACSRLRDEIVSAFGVPPAKVGIIETGNLGGGTAEGQDKTFRINTIIPICSIILEKLNYHLLQVGFGITDYELQFEEIDYRDSEVVEKIRDMRLRNGSYTINRYRDEIGEPPIDGGDDAVIVDRGNIVAWDDMMAMSKAMIANKAAPMTVAGVDGYVPGLPDAEHPEPPPNPLLGLHPAALADPLAAPGGAKDATQGKEDPQGDPPKESVEQRDQRRLSEAWARAYRARRAQALRELPEGEKVTV
ncbi:MAG: phage portal protein [Candidatus Dormibacteria bacterium]